MPELPETVLQFGAGRFLRAFADLFIQQANAEGRAVGGVVVIQSTEGERARLLNAQSGRYNVLIRGLENGEIIDRAESVESVRRALVAQTDWKAVLEVARSPELRFVLSNTTEAGLALDPADGPADAPPRSFPAKLLALLRASRDAGLPGPTILPCELIEDNADLLRALVLEQSALWNWDMADWLETECRWRNSLVDRIVVGPPAQHPLLKTDKLLVTAEPYALWAIETLPGDAPPFAHPAIVATADIAPYFLRKVRILNAAHTALVNKAVPRGFQIVREAVQDPEIGDWLRRLLFEEIVPTLEGRVEQPAAFANQVLERFANPFQEHKFSDIALHHDRKIAVRLAPAVNEFRERFGREPNLLLEALGR